MTLLPIIYTSLMIFSGFLFFVIIFSYISFKIKGGQKSVRHPEFLVQKPIINNSPVRIIPNVPAVRQNYQQEFNPVKKLDQSQQSYQNQNFVPQKQVTSRETRRPEQIQRNIASNSFAYEQYRKNDNHQRIEIMNTAEKYRQTSYYQESSNRNSRPVQSLTDVNLLNYYSDRNDSGFVSLKAI